MTRDDLVKKLGEILKHEQVTVVIPALAELAFGWCQQESDVDYVIEVMEAAIDYLTGKKPSVPAGERLH